VQNKVYQLSEHFHCVIWGFHSKRITSVGPFGYDLPRSLRQALQALNGALAPGQPQQPQHHTDQTLDVVAVDFRVAITAAVNAKLQKMEIVNHGAIIQKISNSPF